MTSIDIQNKLRRDLQGRRDEQLLATLYAVAAVVALGALALLSLAILLLVKPTRDVPNADAIHLDRLERDAANMRSIYEIYGIEDQITQ